jgi:hypothetical protein
VRVLLLQLVVAPLLVGAATLTARRFGEHAGGMVSAFPAIVGPVLLVGAHDHGTVFAAREAVGTLLGLVALSGFIVAYAHTALRADWRASLAVAWIASAAIAALLPAVAAGPIAGLTAAATSLALAYRLLPGAGTSRPPSPPRRWELAVRMSLTAVLVVSLSAAARLLGPLAGGVLAALPLLASVLAVFTHRRHGAAALVALLRGMLAGMAGFVIFCVVVAVLVDRAGTLTAFAAATLGAVAAQAAVAMRSPHSAFGQPATPHGVHAGGVERGVHVQPLGSRRLEPALEAHGGQLIAQQQRDRGARPSVGPLRRIHETVDADLLGRGQLMPRPATGSVLATGTTRGTSYSLRFTA